MAILYRHIRLDKNEPFYIGVGVARQRAFDKTNRNKYWKHITTKTDYRVDILFDDLTWEQAREKEKEFIELYGRKDLGTGTLVNMTDGGDGTKGRYGNTEKQLQSKKRGAEHYRYGKKMDEQSVKKMMESFSKKEKKPSFAPRSSKKNPWRVYFRCMNNIINLGHFHTQEQAQEAIDIWKKNNNI